MKWIKEVFFRKLDGEKTMIYSSQNVLKHLPKYSIVEGIKILTKSNYILNNFFLVLQIDENLVRSFVRVDYVLRKNIQY